MPKVVLIDNYDSFTWNVYEYLNREGADVVVFRNDQVSVIEVEALNPDIIVISPGPGHPDTDSGISKSLIQTFMGRTPIFGICMGMQCIVSLFGGTIEFAGEVVHGKTSPISHDGKGAFKGVTDGVAVTRYHSLASRIQTLPECLEITCTSDSGVIQGVRHKKFVIEGVQFHPESIMSEEGIKIIRNILNFKGGKWSDTAGSVPISAKQSILDKIFDQRQKDVQLQISQPGHSFEALEQSLSLGIAPKSLNVLDRVKESRMHLLAEVKRASPSKGDIALYVHAPTQARSYAEAGASVISVLTEPKWFKGSIDDLRLARLAVDDLPNRPAILRKEFIFSKYQILEARLNGADTVLLIVKMLQDSLLQELYLYSQSLGMEPLVEVANANEMQRAIAIGSRFIGVNNRDLHSFSVDMSTTSSLVSLVPPGTFLAALSGISGREQVDLYEKEGVKGILVGEALMRADNPSKFVESLIG